MGTKHNFEILLCRNCQTLYTAFLPLSDESENYDEYYSEENLAVPDFINKRLTEIVGEFSGFRQTNRLLDIGFGAGTILQIASEQKWQAFGIEVSAPAVEHAKKLGFEVFHGVLEAAKYPDDYFDVITASEILEHLPEPQKLLDEVARILRPDGLFWATTPSAKSLAYRLVGIDWSVLYPPEHIQLFSKAGMRKMLNNSGFSKVRLHTHGLNPSEIADIYKSKFKHNETNKISGYNRVEAGYELNSKLTSSPTRQKIKNTLNNTLSLLQLGDSLKIYAQL